MDIFEFGKNEIELDSNSILEKNPVPIRTQTKKSKFKEPIRSSESAQLSVAYREQGPAKFFAPLLITTLSDTQKSVNFDNLYDTKTPKLANEKWKSNDTGSVQDAQKLEDDQTTIWTDLNIDHSDSNDDILECFLDYSITEPTQIENSFEISDHTTSSYSVPSPDFEDIITNNTMDVTKVGHCPRRRSCRGDIAPSFELSIVHCSNSGLPLLFSNDNGRLSRLLYVDEQATNEKFVVVVDLVRNFDTDLWTQRDTITLNHQLGSEPVAAVLDHGAASYFSVAVWGQEMVTQVIRVSLQSGCKVGQMLVPGHKTIRASENTLFWSDKIV